MNDLDRDLEIIAAATNKGYGSWLNGVIADFHPWRQESACVAYTKHFNPSKVKEIVEERERLRECLESAMRFTRLHIPDGAIKHLEWYGKAEELLSNE